MSDPLRPLRVDVLPLLREPGRERHVEAVVDGAALDVVHQALDGPVSVDLRIESVHDGLVVRGEIRTPWEGVCRRCLRELSGVDRTAVDELYQSDVTEPEAFPIERYQLDLAPVARETALLALDDERLCEAACAGLCPVCGVDRNVTTCSCEVTVRDERWAVLDELRVDD